MTESAEKNFPAYSHLPENENAQLYTQIQALIAQQTVVRQQAARLQTRN